MVGHLRRIGGALLGVVIVVAGAAGAEPASGHPAEQRQCRFNGDCDGIALCAGGWCRAQCMDDRDCVTEATCVRRPTAEFTACVPKQRPPVVWQRMAAPERFTTITGGAELYAVTRATVGGGGRLARVVIPGRTVRSVGTSWVDVGPSMPEIVLHRPSELFGLDDQGHLQRLDRPTKTWSPVVGSPSFKSVVEGFDDVLSPAQGGPAQPPGEGRGFTSLYAIGLDAKLWRVTTFPDRFLPVEKESAMVVTGIPKAYDGPSAPPRATFIDPTGNDRSYDGVVRDVRSLPPLPAGVVLKSYAGLGAPNGWALTEDGKVLRHQLGAWEPIDSPTFRKLAVVQPTGVYVQAILFGLDEQGAIHSVVVPVPTGTYVRPGYQ